MDLSKTKAVILAGGYGSRLSEETDLKPKPMVEIGGKPILWHIMKIYSFYGVNQFIICLGYKGNYIKDYFLNYFMNQSNINLDLKNNDLVYENKNKQKENWKLNLVDTGLDTMTGGRLKKVSSYLKDDKFFFMTYGDAVTDINIADLAKFHVAKKKIATLTAVNPPERFGRLSIMKNSVVKSFVEKPKSNDILINGGFFCFSNQIFKYLKNDETVLEQQPLKSLVSKKQLVAFKHNKFWQPMDTIFEKNRLNALWSSKNPPWKKW
tara:strand:- start:90 stop:884 length:795 start_codon:yes stop_codon:yes gene_type:complete